MKKDSKNRLFEIMKKTNPDFKVINEQQIYSPNTTQPNAEQLSGDVRSIQNSATSSQKSAYSRIDTPDEFSQAFRLWFSSLGFNPQKNPIDIGRVTFEVEKIMKELGYK
jgi:hypothetical protein